MLSGTLAHKSLGGCERNCQQSIGEPDWWMFCLFGRWLLKRAISNELLRRFLEKTPSQTCLAGCNDLHKLPILRHLLGFAPQKVATCKPCPGNIPPKWNKCLTNVAQKLSNIFREGNRENKGRNPLFCRKCTENGLANSSGVGVRI